MENIRQLNQLSRNEPADFHIDGDLKVTQQALRPYKAKCRYLKTNDLKLNINSISGHSVFSIPESCYIDDTGHFNAVEFNICYNQMMYCSIANGIATKSMPEFDAWSIDDFWEKQLPDVLITRFSSRFKKVINSNRFYGEIEFGRTLLSRKGTPTLFIKTRCKYWDDFGGYADGEVDLAILNTIVK